MSMEARPSPLFVALEEEGYWYEPYETCCFDLASWPRACSWQAQVMCERCAALRELCQGESRDLVQSGSRGEGGAA